jgi:hypothetical protein
VINYELVLASGEVIYANQKTNHDMFLALKGGSNNFGIVTRFDMPTFAQGKMWGGALYYDSSAYPQLIQAFSDFAADPSPDERAHIIVATSWIAGRETAISNIYHSAPGAVPSVLVPFIALQPQISSSLREDSLLGFAEEQASFITDGRRQLFFTTTYRLDKQLMCDTRELWLEALKLLERIAGFMLYLIFQPLTKVMLSKSAPRGGNVLGLKPEDGPLVIVLLNSVHSNSSDDDRVVAAVLSLVKKIEELAAQRSKAAKYRFTNYAYKGQKVIEGYGEESVKRLWAVSRKYDPEGFFQKAVPGGFKLPTVSECDLEE